MSIEAMKQVKTMLQVGMPEYDINDALQVLDEAIEQAEKQEPVAWMDGYRNIYSLEEKAAGCEDAVIPLVPAIQHWSDCAVHNEPAYQKGDCDCGGYTTPPAAPVQEPSGFFRYEDVCGDEVGKPVPYYLAPPAAQRQWVGLTDDAKHELALQFFSTSWTRRVAIGMLDAHEAKLREKNT